MTWWPFTSGSSSSSTQHSGDNGESNSQAGPSTAPEPPRVDRFQTMLKDEEAYQTLQYPTTDDVPGCMQLLDEFLMSYALMPQLRHLYRYGELRQSTRQFQDFKYCLSVKSEDEEGRRRLWIQRRAAWWAGRRAEGSSEDVWDIRTEKLSNFPPVHPPDAEQESATTFG